MHKRDFYLNALCNVNWPFGTFLLKIMLALHDFKMPLFFSSLPKHVIKSCDALYKLLAKL